MKKYSGIHVPLITPFKNGKVDYLFLDILVDYYCKFDIASISPCGSTGESCTLTHDEQKKIISYVVDKVNGRKKVIAGTGSNNTIEAIDLTKHAFLAGADACLVVSPYYNKPTQQGIIEYYSEIVERVPIDIIIYDIPSRTGSLLSIDTIITLSKNKYIKGIKEGCSEISRFQELTGYFLDSDFSILTGEDTLLLECLSLGGDGGIMATAGVIPSELIKLKSLLDEQKIIEARRLNHHLLPLINKLFEETNPILIKYAICKILNIEYELRSPLTSASQANMLDIKNLLIENNII